MESFSWVRAFGNGYFTNYKNVILRDNLGMVIILNQEEIGETVCVVLTLIFKNHLTLAQNLF